MPATTRDNLKLLYEGSVKRVYEAPKQAERLWFEFTDDYSVFDWGKMPDTIANKGRALTVLGAHFFNELSDAVFWRQLKSSKSLAGLNAKWLERLWNSAVYKQFCDGGMPSHYHRLCNEQGSDLSLPSAAGESGAVYMEVERAEVFRPQLTSVLGQPVYYYQPIADRQVRRLVPLEIVFRFGMPAGSSLKERLQRDPDYAMRLGLTAVPAAGSMFDRPVLEFYTKLEPKDRLLSSSEALNISTLDPEQFSALTDSALLAAVALLDLFGAQKIELWDGKFEFIFSKGKIRLADSIGPDELRLIYQGLQLSKETIRQAYRGSQWELSLKKAQKLAAERGASDWKAICRDELKERPAALPQGFKSKIDKLYGVLANSVTGHSLFTGQPDLPALARSFAAEGRNAV